MFVVVTFLKISVTILWLSFLKPTVVLGDISPSLTRAHTSHAISYCTVYRTVQVLYNMISTVSERENTTFVFAFKILR